MMKVLEFFIQMWMVPQTLGQIGKISRVLGHIWRTTNLQEYGVNFLKPLTEIEYVPEALDQMTNVVDHLGQTEKTLEHFGKIKNVQETFAYIDKTPQYFV